LSVGPRLVQALSPKKVHADGCERAATDGRWSRAGSKRVESAQRRAAAQSEAWVGEQSTCSAWRGRTLPAGHGLFVHLLRVRFGGHGRSSDLVERYGAARSACSARQYRRATA